ncbi:transglutaminaseTgpA domain-containing protein [Nocardioides sp.]|uniref:transglutaminase family protein n=1 Tax=Nocardioides sp. TaxID=35761 RepID=UPI003D135841
MSRPRVSLRQGLLFAVVTGLTVWFTLLTWTGFAQESGEFLTPLFVLALVLPIGGAALRWLRTPVLVVPLVQLAVAGLVLVAWFGNGSGSGHLPTPAAVADTIQAIRDSVATARDYASPVPAGVPTVAPLLVGCGALALILVDLLAGGLGRVPASGLVLLMVYTLPVTIWGRSITWSVFVLAAGGFLVMLFLREDERFSQWGRQITAEPSAANDTGFGVRTGSARSNAFTVGATATLAALILPALIPTLSLDLLGNGRGPGNGDNVTIVNPMTDLRRDLKQGRDVPLLFVTTDQPDPSYLRYSVLTNFNGREWTTGDRAIPGDQTANGKDLPAPVGVDKSVPTTTYDATYQSTDDFRSYWLPVPFPAATVEAPGLWKYDRSTMDFLSGNNEFATDLSYAATGVDLDLTQDQLLAAGAPPVSILTDFTELPEGLPPLVRKLAFDLTVGRTTDFERAVILQNWFRSDGGFRYSLATSSGNGSSDLEAFLSDGPNGRVGYCEQFASAMAVMARSIGIPARVAVGFLIPDQTGVDSYVYSSKDLHAWPELYFEGSGWVRFEPTPGGPGGRTGAAPAYTRGGLPEPEQTDSTSASASQSQEPSAATASADKPTVAPDAGATDSADTSGFPWVRALLLLLGLMLLVVLVMVPRTLRRLRREARWRLGTAEAAWAELRDAATDLGVPCPPGRSPRATGDQLGEHFAAVGDLARPVLGRATDPVASAALERLVLALEIERYAPRPLEVPTAQLREDVIVCVSALRNGVNDRRRRQAEWLPRSLLVSGRPSARPHPDDVESVTNSDQIVEHVGQ